MQHRRHKTKLLIPAGAGTSQPAEVGDQPGRLGEGRNRIPRAAITCRSIENIHPGTKKRRVLCIVVSRLPAVFQRLMLLDYQIGLDFASEVVSMYEDRIENRAHQPTKRRHSQG
jgi:hypothetical protein